MTGRVKILVVLLLAAFPAVAGADSVPERFDRGTAEFEHKNFGNAVQILKELLYPAVQLTSEDDIVAAREMLGLSFFYVGEKAKAHEEFTLLLYLRPRHRLDPFLVPPPAVAFFDRIWNDPVMKEKLEKIEKERQEKERLESEKKEKEKPPKTVVRRIYMQSREEHHSRILTFLPFGIGQFQNGHNTKGVLLASGGGLALVTNITCFGLLYGLRKKDSHGNRYYEDVPLAEALEITGYVSFGVFLAAWIYGVVDASLYFEPVVKTPDVKTKEETEELDGEPTSLLPALFPGGAGLTFSARF